MIEFSVTGGNVVANFLKGAGTKVKAFAFLGVTQALDEAFEKSYELITADDHSLKDLADLDHPYSVRAPQQIHLPDETVHSQSGDYADHLEKTSPRGLAESIIEGRVFNEDYELDRWIQDGTLKMRARPWAKWVARTYGVRLIEIVRAAIAEGMVAQKSWRGGSIS